MLNAHIIVFAKAPRQGYVKTRLAASIGPAAACAAYQELVRRVLARLAGLRQLEIRLAPDDAASEIADWLRPGWTVRPQGGGDLGERLARAVFETLSQRPGPLIMIGSDCPDVEIGDLEAAAAALNARLADVVLGPAPDGGYWLVALDAVHPGLFQRIAWSTDQVLRQTLEAAASAGLRVTLLRELEDVDTASEWASFQRRSGNGQWPMANSRGLLGRGTKKRRT